MQANNKKTITYQAKIAQVGTIFSALLASACCWLPLLLLAVGVSGVAVSATLAKYRLLFGVLTFGFLGAAFYFTYRPRKAVVTSKNEADCCEVPKNSEVVTSGENCCPPKKKKDFSIQKFNKGMLWIITPLALAFVFFPNYVNILFAGSNSLSAESDLQKVVVKVEGMTCQGCALHIQKSLMTVPEVEKAEVSYERGEAIIGIKDENNLDKQSVLEAISKAGYKGTFLEILKKQQ